MASCRRTPPSPSRGSSPSLLFPVSSLPRRSRPHSAAAAASAWHGRWLDEPRGPPPLSRVPDAHPALLLAGRGVHRSLEAAHEELRARCRALASENGALRARARALEQAEEGMRARAERLGRQEGVLLEAQETYAQLRQQLEQAHEHSRALQHEMDTLKQKSNDRFSSLRSAVAHAMKESHTAAMAASGMSAPARVSLLVHAADGAAAEKLKSTLFHVDWEAAFDGWPLLSSPAIEVRRAEPKGAGTAETALPHSTLAALDSYGEAVLLATRRLQGVDESALEAALEPPNQTAQVLKTAAALDVLLEVCHPSRLGGEGDEADLSSLRGLCGAEVRRLVHERVFCRAPPPAVRHLLRAALDDDDLRSPAADGVCEEVLSWLHAVLAYADAAAESGLAHATLERWGAARRLSWWGEEGAAEEEAWGAWESGRGETLTLTLEFGKAEGGEGITPELVHRATKAVEAEVGIPQRRLALLAIETAAPAAEAPAAPLGQPREMRGWSAEAWLESLDIKPAIVDAMFMSIKKDLGEHYNAQAELAFMYKLAELGSQDVVLSVLNQSSIMEHLAKLLWDGITRLRDEFSPAKAEESEDTGPASDRSAEAHGRNSRLTAASLGFDMSLPGDEEAAPHSEFDTIYSLLGRHGEEREKRKEQYVVERLHAIEAAFGESLPLEVERAEREGLEAQFEKLQAEEMARKDLEKTNEELATEGAANLRLGDASLFYGGLQSVVGNSRYDMLTGIDEEHTMKADADVPFASPTHRVQTTSRIEHAFVAHAEGGPQQLRLDAWPSSPHAPREGRPISAFQQEWERVNARLASARLPALSEACFVALRLYSGPMYIKYNTLLRARTGVVPALKRVADDWCCDNLYSSTICAITLGVVLLGKITRACPVYRALGGGVLPDCFWEADGQGVRGGVVPGLMSTTSSKAEAIHFARNSSCRVLVEVQQGLASRGASIAWLSQFPKENEVIFPPLGVLELGRMRVEGSVVIVELRPTLAGTTLAREVDQHKKVQQLIAEKILADQQASEEMRFLGSQLHHADTVAASWKLRALTSYLQRGFRESALVVDGALPEKGERAAAEATTAVVLVQREGELAKARLECAHAEERRLAEEERRKAVELRAEAQRKVMEGIAEKLRLEKEANLEDQREAALRLAMTKEQADAQQKVEQNEALKAGAQEWEKLKKLLARMGSMEAAEVIRYLGKKEFRADAMWALALIGRLDALVKRDASNAAKLQEAHGFTLLGKILADQAAAGSPGVQLAVVGLLNTTLICAATKDREEIKRTLTSDVTTSVARLMRTEANNKAVQQAGVQLLAQLTSGAVMTSTSKEEVAAVLAAMRTNAADMSLQTLACKFIGDASRASLAFATLALDMGAAEHINEVLKRLLLAHGSARKRGEATLVFVADAVLSIAKGNDNAPSTQKRRKRLGSSGIIETIVFAAKMHEDTPFVAASCIKALRQVITGGPELRQAALEAGAKREWVAS